MFSFLEKGFTQVVLMLVRHFFEFHHFLFIYVFLTQLDSVSETEWVCFMLMHDLW